MALLQCGRPVAIFGHELPFRRRSFHVLQQHIVQKSVCCRMNLAFERGRRRRERRVWHVMASDSQAQDEEYEEDDIDFSEFEDDEDAEEEDEDNVDVDVLSNEEIDALMEEHGNVVKSDPEPRNTAANDMDADAEALSMAIALAKVANEVKAVDIRVLHVKPLIYWARYFIIASAFSMPQLNAIAGRMEDIALEQFNKTPKKGDKPSSWTLIDFGDVVVHIFLPAQREYYNLEEFYANAPVVELPFASERTSRETSNEELTRLS